MIQCLYMLQMITTLSLVGLVTKSCPTLATPGTVACQATWDFPGKNTGVDCHFLLQWIFPMQGSNLCLPRLLHWQADSLPLSHLGSPHIILDYCINAINTFAFNFILSNRNSALTVHSFIH